MTAVKKTIPLPSEVKNFPTDQKAVIIHDKVNDVLRVVVREYYWDSVAERGKEKRKYLGYVVDNTYYATADYRRLFKKKVSSKTTAIRTQRDPAKTVSPQSPCKTGSSLIAGEIPVYLAIADKIGLTADLTAAYGKRKADLILSITCHWLNTPENDAGLYASWAEGRFLPSTERPSLREMREFFDSLSEDSAGREAFFKARAARLTDDELVAIDASDIATAAARISYTQFGCSDDCGWQKRVGMIVLVGRKSGMPAGFDLLPGQITDVSTVPDLLFRFGDSAGKRVFAAALDSAYCSLEALGRFINAKRPAIVTAKTDVPWIQEAVDRARPLLRQHSSRIPGKECWGTTVEQELTLPVGQKHTVWVHVYRSDAKAHIENAVFYRSLEAFENEWANWNQDGLSRAADCPLLQSPLLKYFKKPEGQPGMCRLEDDDEAINTTTRYFGFYCDVSTMKCTAAEALYTHQTRDVIKKSFAGGKTDIEIDVRRAHKDNTLEGRFLVGFAAMSILCELLRLMRQPTKLEQKKGSVKDVQPLAGEMTVNELKNRLSSIRMLYTGSGEKHWLEVTGKQHEIARRLGFIELYETIPDLIP